MQRRWIRSAVGLPWWLISPLIIAFILGSGCTPRHYRAREDREAYRILAEKSQQPNWWTPPQAVDPPPQSRNYDPHDPDHPPMPPDDPAAHRYMHCADGKHGYPCWHGRGDAPSVESPQWLACLPMTADERLELNQERAVELGLLNSREYQLELENLYLAALALSLERFEFDTQWSLTNSTHYERLGKSISGRFPRESNTLSTNTNLGLTRAFAGGGQVLVDFANTFVWEFTATDSTAAFSNLTVSLVQPILRGAFRDVRLEPLTQAERNVLYAVRDYARFRKQFYFGIVSGEQGYLSLLLQLQAILNLEANLESLRLNLRTHEALAKAGIVSLIQVDQVFQSYQAGRLRLIRAQNDLETSLDSYKIHLGLPPDLDIKLDNSQLTPFELNSPEITRLQDEIEGVLAAFRELDAAPQAERLEEGIGQMRALQERVSREAEAVAEELKRWEAKPSSSDTEQAPREEKAKRMLRSRLDELRGDILKLSQEIDVAGQSADESRREEGWERLQWLARRQSAQVGDVFVIQTQVRAYLIELDPIGWKRDEAVSHALTNRLDLMNRQARVVDAWRKIRVAADALEADLDVVAEADIGTNPDKANPVAFSSNASRYRVGLRFDGPLNRKLESTVYRAELIAYQRARRNYIGSCDGVVQAVRLDVRELEANRLNFEIARQSLITAARQVELARLELLAPGAEGDSSTTQDVLDALDTLLEAKNALIDIWITYETNRLRLLLDTEALQLDERGFPREDDSDSDREPDASELVSPDRSGSRTTNNPALTGTGT